MDVHHRPGHKAQPQATNIMKLSIKAIGIDGKEINCVLTQSGVLQPARDVSHPAFLEPGEWRRSGLVLCSEHSLDWNAFVALLH